MPCFFALLALGACQGFPVPTYTVAKKAPPPKPIVTATATVAPVASSSAPAKPPPPSGLPAFVDGPVGKLHVDDSGTGSAPAVIFVGGLGGTIDAWKAQLDHVRKTRRAIALEVRGHGQSAAPSNNDYAIDSLAADVGAVADAAKLDHFVLVGQGVGATIAVAYANGHAAKLSGLLLADTAPDATKMPWADPSAEVAALTVGQFKDWTATYAHTACGKSADVEQRLVAGLRTLTLDGAKAVLVSLKSYPTADKLGGYKGPLELVVTDALPTPGSLEAQMPAVKKASIPETSHCLMMDKPDAFNTTLDDFLASLDAAKSP
jgi:pimeloyl-ACP methyl ester carboxylesterase